MLILLFVESSYTNRFCEVVDMKAALEADVALMSHRVCVLVLLTESRRGLVSESLSSLYLFLSLLLTALTGSVVIKKPLVCF